MFPFHHFFIFIFPHLTHRKPLRAVYVQSLRVFKLALPVYGFFHSFQGWSALAVATAKNHLPVVEELLQSGANFALITVQEGGVFFQRAHFLFLFCLLFLLFDCCCLSTVVCLLIFFIVFLFSHPFHPLFRTGYAFWVKQLIFIFRFHLFLPHLSLSSPKQQSPWLPCLSAMILPPFCELSRLGSAWIMRFLFVSFLFIFFYFYLFFF